MTRNRLSRVERPNCSGLMSVRPRASPLNRAQDSRLKVLNEFIRLGVEKFSQPDQKSGTESCEFVSNE